MSASGPSGPLVYVLASSNTFIEINISMKSFYLYLMQLRKTILKNINARKNLYDRGYYSQLNDEYSAVPL